MRVRVRVGLGFGLAACLVERRGGERRDNEHARIELEGARAGAIACGVDAARPAARAWLGLGLALALGLGLAPGSSAGQPVQSRALA